MRDYDVLIHAIEAAWAESSYSEEVHRALSVYTAHPEEQEARGLFRGRHWEDISDAVLLANCPNPFLIAGPAFRYYLPAFMIAAIRHRDEMFFEEVLGHLTLPKKPEAVARFYAKFEGLSGNQKKAVALFLETVRDIEFPRDQWGVQDKYHERWVRRIDRSLHGYWEKEVS